MEHTSCCEVWGSLDTNNERNSTVATKRAKVLDDTMFATMMMRVARGAHPLRDQVMMLLSYKAGLRATEIAGLEWTDVTDAKGVIRTDFLFIPSDIAKRNNERQVPMHPQLHLALMMLRAERPDDRHIVYSTSPKRYIKRMTANAVTKWFWELYRDAGFEGCSSHSGRRTFITRLGQRAGLHDCSIRDVMMLAGHRSMKTTEGYIDLSQHVSRLVAAV
jgi:integrase/recombinase XerD